MEKKDRGTDYIVITRKNRDVTDTVKVMKSLNQGGFQKLSSSSMFSQIPVGFS